ncbi:Zinc finger, RING-type [Corchorus olitorius]|uniref:Zinc finger, RING-type n=1 Tax=Corchorus olitorius TaxID=93759 RepID=A0A1R3KFC3_9ROSI|nr:Zinc finger, RING-type [Corchorus olitorius]
MDCFEFSASSSCQDYLKVLEADIQHANMLAASIPRAKGDACFQMKLVLSDGRPSISSCGRKATIGEFYSVILPSLQRLHGDLSELDVTTEEDHCFEMVGKKKSECKRKVSDVELEREDECGICLEPCNKIVLPNCCHAMCINCYRDWSLRSESCPFCRGSLKRVTSGDLWVLTRSTDVVETQTVLKEDMLRFHLIGKSPDVQRENGQQLDVHIFCSPLAYEHSDFGLWSASSF